jgi:hypothetical protein
MLLKGLWASCNIWKPLIWYKRSYPAMHQQQPSLAVPLILFHWHGALTVHSHSSHAACCVAQLVSAHALASLLSFLSAPFAVLLAHAPQHNKVP